MRSVITSLAGAAILVGCGSGAASSDADNSGTPTILEQTGSNALTRSQAQSLLNRHPTLADRVTTVRIVHGGVDGAIAEGLFRVVGSASYQTLELTDEGRNHFARVNGRPGSFISTFSTIELLAPVRRNVAEVTGVVGDAPGTKEVQFTWYYIGLSDLAGRITGQGSGARNIGTALFRLYDDGWRVEHVGELRESPGPYVPDPQRVAHGQSLRNAVSDAKMPTRTLGEYDLTERIQGHAPRIYKVTVTDANVTIQVPGPRPATVTIGHWELSVRFEPFRWSMACPNPRGCPYLSFGNTGRTTGATIQGERAEGELFEQVYRQAEDAASDWKQRFPNIRQ